MERPRLDALYPRGRQALVQLGARGGVERRAEDPLRRHAAPEQLAHALDQSFVSRASTIASRDVAKPSAKSSRGSAMLSRWSSSVSSRGAKPAAGAGRGDRVAAVAALGGETAPCRGEPSRRPQRAAGGTVGGRPRATAGAFGEREHDDPELRRHDHERVRVVAAFAKAEEPQRRVRDRDRCQ